MPVLLVEDDDDVAAAVAELLTDEGYAVQRAPNGADALARLKGGYRPAVMLVDYAMPEMTGAELLRACGDDPRVADIPTIVMSARRSDELASAGVEGYLRKPFDSNQLLDQLARLVKGR
jgi:CheY-like chemotaxis protein